MGARVLLAAESISLQELLPQGFSPTEAEVTCVSDGISARRLIGELDPDLLIAEISLSGVNGYELCEYVRERARHRRMPVILVDSQFEVMNQSQACKSGVDIYLAKPFEPREFVGIVSRLIRREREDRADGVSGGSMPSGEGLSADAASEIREPSSPQPDSRHTEGPRLREAAADTLATGPGDPARDGDPDDAGLRGQPFAINRAVLPRTRQPAGRRNFPALLWVILLGLILGSLVMLAPKSPSSEDAPAIKQGVVSASDAQPQTAPPDERQAGPSSQSPESSAPVAGDSPATDGGVENSVAEESVHFSPLSLDSLTTKSPSSERAGDSAPNATGRAPESMGGYNKSVDDAGPAATSARVAFRARASRQSGSGSHLKRGGGQMVQAGKNIGSGFKHFGMAGKDSAVWSGKKAGKGVKGLGKAMKGLFN
ncbi:MAG TPA: response regulator [Blastocatellia bacterium]|nr:response regulator [Blastocatellia bacterium]